MEKQTVLETSHQYNGTGADVQPCSKSSYIFFPDFSHCSHRACAPGNFQCSKHGQSGGSSLGDVGSQKPLHSQDRFTRNSTGNTTGSRSSETAARSTHEEKRGRARSHIRIGCAEVVVQDVGPFHVPGGLSTTMAFHKLFQFSRTTRCLGSSVTENQALKKPQLITN